MTKPYETYELSAAGIFVVLDLGLGQISKFEVMAEGRKISPFHTVPWINDPSQVFPDGTAPHLERMSIDFFCAPFSTSDIENAPPHGWPANSEWELVEEELLNDGRKAVFRLIKRVMGGELFKTFVVRDNHPFLYQSHRFVGASGKIPVSYHTMVNLASGGSVSVSPKLWAETMTTALETDPHMGKSVLAYPARSADPRAFPRDGGGNIDLLSYPLAEVNEDLAMLIEDPNNSLGWSVVARAQERDLAIILKSPSVLPSTLFWYSNGGRFYEPWSGRHRGVLGIEECCSYFGYGHAASNADNPLNDEGIATALDLGFDVEIKSVIGACAMVGENTTFDMVAPEGEHLVISSPDVEMRLLFDAAFFAP